VNSPRRFRRGASILPSLFTTGNLFLGFWAIIKTLDGRYAEAAPLVAGAIVLDLLDGRIARLTGTASEFGAQLDSLSDAISFGVAPALLGWGLTCCFLLLTVVALRVILAREFEPRDSKSHQPDQADEATVT